MSGPEDKMLDEKLDACRKLALHVSHKIRNPLSALLNILYQMKRRSQLDESSKDLLLILDEEIYHLKLISDELAMFSSSPTGETSRVRLDILLSQFKDNFQKECILIDDDSLEIAVADEKLAADIDPQFLFSVLKTIIFNILIKTDSKQKVKLGVRKSSSDLIFLITSPMKHDLGIKKEGLKQLVTSSEENIIVNLSMALVEYCLVQREGKILIKDDESDSTQIQIHLPVQS